ncbi:MAG: hypothetical protein ABIT37_05325 [Luteolibacter sp.]
MNFLTKFGVGVFALIVAFSMMSQCNRREAVRYSTDTPVQTQTQTQTYQQPQSTDVILKEYSKGLDLNAITALAKKARDAEDFERLLNSQSEAVNNIDLNDDNKVDYIEVTEYGSGDKRGFSLTDEIAPGKIQEIATIEFQRENNAAVVQTTGNPSLYGPATYHHSSFGLTDALLVGWLFSNRPTYSSPYGYGNYPPSYGGGWNRQDTDSYTGSMRSRTAGSTVRTSSQPVISNPPTSPNADKIAAKAKAISNPTQSQRSFTNPSASSSTSRPSSNPSSPASRPTSTPSSSSRPSSSNTSSSTSRPTSSGGFGRSSSSGSSRSGSSSRGGK